MTSFQAVLLGVLQGITEFFPVSSSGHLALAQQFFSIHENVLVFDIYVHFGTLLAIVVVFRKSLVRIVFGCYKGVLSLFTANGNSGGTILSIPEVRTALGIAVGTIPAVLAGLVFRDGIELLFHSGTAVYGALFFTGSVLLATFLIRERALRIGIMAALVIGCAQALAIIPGISRSGMTISVALFLGIARDEAGEFSFLLAIPVIAGATILALYEQYASTGFLLSPGIALTGTVASFFTGWVSLVVLLRVVRRGKLGYFGFYCIAVSLFGAVVSLGWI